MAEQIVSCAIYVGVKLKAYEMKFCMWPEGTHNECTIVIPSGEDKELE